MSVRDSLLDRLGHELAVGERGGEIEDAPQMTVRQRAWTRVPTIVAIEFAESVKAVLLSRLQRDQNDRGDI